MLYYVLAMKDYEYNNKIVVFIGIIILVIISGLFFLLNSGSKNTAPIVSAIHQVGRATITNNINSTNSNTQQAQSQPAQSKNSDDFNFTAQELPSFQFSSVAYASDLKDKTTIYNSKGEQMQANLNVNQSGNGSSVSLDPSKEFMPGKYTLVINENGKKISQDFTWGVLAINTNKSIYSPGEIAKLALAVLDEKGLMVCDADVTLEIKDPTGKISTASTKDKTIEVNPECSQKKFTLNPDYETEYKVDLVGNYQMSLTAVTKKGTYNIIDSFEVEESADFDVERITATRIFPYYAYPVLIKIIAKKDFSGQIKEVVPESFTISPLENTIAYNSIQKNGGSQYILWNVSVKKGGSINIGYNFKAPEVSPQFYLLGPLSLTFGNALVFEEKRSWQLAIDDITSNIVNTSTSSTATQYSSQRKTFYDSANSLYWVFSNNGSAIAYSYSSNGSSWSSGGTTGVATSDFSVWYVSGTTTVYLAYKDSPGMTVEKGTLGASSIAWGAATVAGTYGTDSNVAISRSSNGKLWIAYYSINTPNRYAWAKQSSNADDPSSWGGVNTLSSGTQLAGQTFGYFSIVPMTTSSNMYFTYGSSKTVTSTIGGNLWTDSNSTMSLSTTIATVTVAGTPSPSSAVSMGSDVVQLVYDDCSSGSGCPSGGEVFYAKYSSGAWNTPIAIDTNTTDLYPTLTKNGTDLYALYIRSNSIYYRKGVSPYAAGNWGGENTLVSTGTNAYLTSSYDTSNVSAIMTWTEGTGSPYNVRFYGLGGGSSPTPNDFELNGLKLNGVKLN